MKYTVEMGSGAMICMPRFIKIGSGIQKLMGEGGIFCKMLIILRGSKVSFKQEKCCEI
jgi:hypothetical protein